MPKARRVSLRDPTQECVQCSVCQVCQCRKQWLADIAEAVDFGAPQGSNNGCASCRQDSLLQRLPHASIIAAAGLALFCCLSLDLPPEWQATVILLTTILLLGGLLATAVVLTHRIVESWSKQRILARTPPWEIVMSKERAALYESDSPRYSWAWLLR